MLAIVDGALPALPVHVPDWAATAIVTAALAGLPLALIMGWFFDLAEGDDGSRPRIRYLTPWTPPPPSSG